MSNQLGFGSMVANLPDFYFMRSPNIEDDITKLFINQILYFKIIVFSDIFHFCTSLLSLVQSVTEQQIHI